MAEDIATETGLVSSGVSGSILSPNAIMGLLLEIQSSLLEMPEHAHLSDSAEDLLFALAHSIKTADASPDIAAMRPKPQSGERQRPQLRIVKGS